MNFVGMETQGLQGKVESKTWKREKNVGARGRDDQDPVGGLDGTYVKNATEDRKTSRMEKEGILPLLKVGGR